MHEGNPFGDLYVNEKTIPDIAVANFGNVIEENSKNEDDGFKKNYLVYKYIRTVHLYRSSKNINNKIHKSAEYI